MKILVTGGCGYKGAVLVPKLLAAGHTVRVIDTHWFGRNLKAHERLEVLKGDLRETLPVEGCEAVVHLAGIANDPCGELDAKLTWEVNVLAHMRLCDAAARAGVKQFVYASSASVYGVKGGLAITEDEPLAPVSDYNKTKMCAERILLSYADRMRVQIVRPATVCGVSPRMRLDVVVNMLASQALSTGKMIAHCGAHGAQLMRPHTHIEDVTDLYCWLIEHPEVTGTFNAGFENQAVADTAKLIAGLVEGARFEMTTVADKRSYLVDSSKLRAAGFAPKRGVADAVLDIALAWREGRIHIADRCFNLRWMQKHGWVAG